VVSRLARRSGYAIAGILELLKWKPDIVYQVGVGCHHAEIEVMLEEWPDVKLIGCEPHPAIMRGLVKGDYPGELHEIAVSDTIGKKAFFSKDNHKDGSSLFPLEKNTTEIVVDVSTLDALFLTESTGKNILLWLDCEGSELDALKGGERFLELVEVINIEMTSKVLGEGGCGLMETHRWLVDHGFKRQCDHTKRSSAGQCDAVYVRHHLWNGDYCTSPCSFMGV